MPQYDPSTIATVVDGADALHRRLRNAIPDMDFILTQYTRDRDDRVTWMITARSNL